MSYQLPADYIDVAERIRQFREKYPDGSLQQVNWKVEEVAGKIFVCYTAAAYRTPDDVRPGIGTAWEPFPGPTPYTRDSELMNAETSAWGRAIIAAGAADAKRVASANEVLNRTSQKDEIPKHTKDSNITKDYYDSGKPEARDLYVFHFGKHKGSSIDDVPSSYLKWLIERNIAAGKNGEETAIYQSELEFRGEI